MMENRVKVENSYNYFWNLDIFFRRTARLRFWQNIVLIYRVVLHKSNKAWNNISGTAKACANKLTILLHFASLYSIYKDVAHSVCRFTFAEECLSCILTIYEHEISK